MNGLGRLVGQLQSGDAALTQSLLRVVCYMANGGAALQAMYQVCARVCCVSVSVSVCMLVCKVVRLCVCVVA